MFRGAEMAKSEIPSIVVQTGCGELGADTGGLSNGDLVMEGAQQSGTQSSRFSRLSKQEEFDFGEDCYSLSPVTIHIEDGSCPNGNSSEGPSSEGLNEQGCHLDLSSGSSDNPGELSPDGSHPRRSDKTGSNSKSHSQSKGASRHLLKQGSSQGSIEGSSPTLSRDSSTETYTDSTGIDLQQFIVDTLHKSQKDRMMLMKIEQDLITLVKDNKCQSFKFSAMSSYNRMLVHRVAAFFGLEHNVDKNGTSVIVNKTKTTRIPDVRFQEHIRDELVPEEPKKLILKRDSASFEEGKESPERQSSMDNKKSKSFEEREEEYEKARARIFNQDSLEILLEGYGESPYSRSHDGTLSSSRRSSQEDLRWTGEPRPWSSTDSDSSGRKGDGSFEGEAAQKAAQATIQANKAFSGLSKSDSETKDSLSCSSSTGLRPTMSKASSFGGISLLTREGTTNTETKRGNPKITKAESFNATPTTSFNRKTPDPPCVCLTVVTNEELPTVLKETEIKTPDTEKISSKDSSQSANVESVPVEVRTAQIPTETTEKKSSSVSISSPLSKTEEVVKSLPLTTPNTVPASQSAAGFPSPPPTLLYIPCVTSQTMSDPTQNTLVVASGNQVSHQHHPSQHMQHNQIFLGQPDQRHFVQEGISLSGLMNQMSSLSFAPNAPTGIVSSHGGTLEYGKSPNPLAPPFFVPSDKGTSYSGQPASAQVPPLYYIQPLAQNLVQPVRYLCQGQPTVKGPSEESSSQNSSHISGQPLMPGYSLLTIAPNVDNLSFSTLPYFSYPPHHPAVSTSSTPPITSSGAMPPAMASSPAPPVYPFMLAAPGGPQVNTLGVNPPNSSHVSSHPLVATPFVGGPPNRGGSIPMCVLTNGASPLSCPPSHGVQSNSNTTSSLISNPYGNLAFRSQTPPTQAGVGGGHSLLGPNGGLGNPSGPPFVSYAFYSPHPGLQYATSSQPSATGQLVTNANHVHHQFGGGPQPSHPPPPQAMGQAGPPPSYMTAFHVLRPSIPVMGNLRNATPPPPPPPPAASQQGHQLSLATGNQQPQRMNCQPRMPQSISPASSQSHRNSLTYGYPLARLCDLNAAEHVPKGVVNHPHSNGKRPGVPPPSLSGPPPVRIPNSSPMFRRIMPGGHPMQPQPPPHQLNPLVFSSQQPSHRGGGHHGGNRFPPPHYSSNTGLSPSPAPSRQSPKHRKQRGRWVNAVVHQGGVGAMGGSPHHHLGKGTTTTGEIYNHQDDGYYRGNHMLTVEGFPEGMKRSELERYLEPVSQSGAKILFRHVEGQRGNQLNHSSLDFLVYANKCRVLASFDSEASALKALTNVKTNKYQLRPLHSSHHLQHHHPGPLHHSQSHHQYHHYPNHHKEGNNKNAPS